MRQRQPELAYATFDRPRAILSTKFAVSIIHRSQIEL